MLAKNLTAARQLSQQFHNRSVGKTYLALVRGGEKSFQVRSGEIRDPIETDGGHVSISQSCRAKFAATDWELVASSVGILTHTPLHISSNTWLAQGTPVFTQTHAPHRVEAPTSCSPRPFITW